MGEKDGKSPEGVKYYRLSEIEEQNSAKATWVIIKNQVYDVTKFLEEVREQLLLSSTLLGGGGAAAAAAATGSGDECQRLAAPHQFIPINN